jgi:hypothetical protein
MKDLRFSITAIVAFITVSVYLIGMNEAEDSFAVATFSCLPILAGLLLASDND